MAVYCVVDKAKDTQAGTQKHLKQHAITIPVAFDKDNTLLKQYGIRAFPTAFLINKDQKILWRGDPRAKELKKHLPLTGR